jgi:hypothetical protein
MTTTNDDGIHPMVMKAARAYLEMDDGDSAPLEFYITKATRILTVCGALELLEAFEEWKRLGDSGCSHDDWQNCLNKRDTIIAKARDVPSDGKSQSDYEANSR